MQGIPHHLKSLIFQAFHKKTPRSDQGSFNFAKSNHFKHLHNQHPRKIDTHKKCDAKCDANSSLHTFFLLSNSHERKNKC